MDLRERFTAIHLFEGVKEARPHRLPMEFKAFRGLVFMVVQSV